MKKALIGFCLAIFVSASLQTTYAADLQLNIDGTAIVSDTKPEIKNKRTMVPLRIISENLGASVEWRNSEVILSKSDMIVRLTLDSVTAEKNGEKIRLDSKPYLRNDRIFVPIRFIAETFDCNVDYSNHVVTVDTKPLIIDGVQVKTLQYEYHMTMGGVVSQVYGNAYIESMYRIFAEGKGQKVEAPASYSWMHHIDIPGSYYKNTQFDFLDTQGNSIVQFDVYSLIRAFPPELLAGYREILIHDVTKDEWYSFSDTERQSIQQFIDNAVKNGFVTVISNTVV
ncbi:MAG TPA: copper amine oxidase N-terminal domain-containing protein [Paenibacillus sp.]|nr:copper amine oxidase N-terminal domain-containing protein [Paenibacillus sp.]